MSPTGAAVTLEALDTGLRQYQPDSRNPVTVDLSGGCRHVTGGDLLQIATGRFREAGESTVTKDTAGGATHSGNCEAVGVRAHFRSVSARRRPSQPSKSPRHPSRSNIFHSGTCFFRTYQSAHPAAGCRYHTEDQNAALAPR
jgi:hypothetical protein